LKSHRLQVETHARAREFIHRCRQMVVVHPRLGFTLISPTGSRVPDSESTPMITSPPVCRLAIPRTARMVLARKPASVLRPGPVNSTPGFPSHAQAASRDPVPSWTPHFQVGAPPVQILRSEPLWPYLILGQWGHLGKGASFGQGRYIVLPRSEAPSIETL
jgi:hypothetical protein